MPAVTETIETVQSVTESTYKWGFETDIEMEFAPKGLNEEIVRAISARKGRAQPFGQPVIRTRIQRTDSLAPSNEDVGYANLGERPDSGEYWSDGPIKSATRTTPQAITHRAWVECTGWPGHWTYYDVITIRESVQTGFPPGSERDLSYYVERIHRDLVSRHLGGSPTGLKTTVKSLTGVETSQRWEHSRRQFVREILAVVLDADGGPECKITPGWNLEIHGAGLGSERDDIALSVHDILEPGWQVDPGARVQDFAVDTGRGSGALALIGAARLLAEAP